MGIVKIFDIPMSFVDLPDMPEVERSSQKVTTERVLDFGGGKGFRQTRVAITAPGVVLGNQRHTFEQRFRGKGGGGKVILVPPGCIVAPRHLEVFTYELPNSPWKLTVEPGAAYAFVFDGLPDMNGEITVIIAEANMLVVDDPEMSTVNTFRDVLVELS